MEYLKEDRRFGQICMDDQDINCATYGHIIKVKKVAKKAVDIVDGNKFSHYFKSNKLSSGFIP